MNAGRLNKRITIQRRTPSRAPSGQPVDKWTDHKTLWAEVVCTDSRTATADGVVQHEGLYRFYIRWTSGITAEMRILWDGRIFELTGPPADWKSNRIGLTLLARELVENATQV